MSGLRFPSSEVRSNLVSAKEEGRGTVLGMLGSYCLTFLPHRGWLDRPSRWVFFLLGLGAAGGVLNLLFNFRKKLQRFR